MGEQSTLGPSSNFGHSGFGFRHSSFRLLCSARQIDTLPARNYSFRPKDGVKGDLSMQEYETLKRLVVEAEEDVNKAKGGNKAAGTRVRKKMQEIKAAAQEVRKKVLEGREGDSEPAAAEPSQG